MLIHSRYRIGECSEGVCTLCPCVPSVFFPSHPVLGARENAPNSGNTIVSLTEV